MAAGTRYKHAQHSFRFLSGTAKDVSEQDVSGKTRTRNHRSLGKTRDSKVMARLNGLKLTKQDNLV